MTFLKKIAVLILIIIEVSIIDNNGKIKIIKKNKKSFIANKIVKFILDKLLVNDRNFN